jgi:Photosynthesis system II assembly factor YCF48
MGKKVVCTKGLAVGVTLLFIGVAVTLVFVMPVSAIIPQMPQVTKKFFDPKISLTSGEWIEQATGFSDPNRSISHISCVNESIVWATAYNNPFLPCQDFTKTVNGGTTWTANTIPDANNLDFSMIYALDAKNAWVPMYAFQNGVNGLYYTSDGGNTWTIQASANFNLVGSFPNCVHFWDANVGWCMGDPSEEYYIIYTTTDGGTTWTRVPKTNIPDPLQGEYGLAGCYCVVDDTIWFGTTMGRVYKSVDKGLHWTVTQTTLTSYTKPTFKDANHGLVIDINIAASTVLSETSDGGATWKKVDFTGPCYNYDLLYIPGTVNMYISAGGESGASYSLDGGHTWTDYADTVGKTMLSLGFTTGKIGWAGSFNIDETTGGIFKHIPTGNPQPAFSIDITSGKGFVVSVENVGDANATEVTCDITITDGLFMTPKEFSGSQANLGIGKNFTVLGTPKGIGLGILTPIPTITINVGCTEGISATKTVQAKIFFSKVTIQ